ncbi:hypothetical protein FHW96_000404 [Novosphingobium sp. SG751A]|uniref:hypothetical protein n=1 Tax=Novosphingobium sp. SG751A TaxID=2587000 RepID=UPI001553E1FC|nr:hypothetical protein [Novosphingobium sp. SG751A]NOW44277.1 hypothetical protein [Novosphingobium sp. SG751A]
MLTLAINGMTGLIAALVIASLIQSARTFMPAWRQLSAEVKRLEAGNVLHATLREASPADWERLAAPTPAPSTRSERPAATAIIPQSRRAFRSTLRHAAA